MNDKKFLQLVDLTQQQLEISQIEPSTLRSIFDDYEICQPKLLDAGEYIQRSLGRLNGVHSTRVRVKSSVSLVRKVVRKRTDNPKRDIRLDNYKDEIRDLIGLRAFHLFKDDWKTVHKEILATWELHPKEKKPLAYIRRGDDVSLQNAFKDAGCKVVEKSAGYRSVHYVLQTRAQKQPYYAEVQVRTLFEEAWSEIDHCVRYPDHQDDEILNDYLLILNRLAGGADEMASLLLRVKAEIALWQRLKIAEETKRQEAEKELTKVKSELGEIMSDLKLTREQQQRLQNQIDRIPEIYKRSPEKMQRILEHHDAAELAKLMGAPYGGLGYHNLSPTQLVEARKRQRQAQTTDEEKG